MSEDHFDLGKFVDYVHELRDERDTLRTAMFIQAVTVASALAAMTAERGALVNKLTDMRKELRDCADALPGTYYMDPPDGGSVSIPEQLRRMAEDAASWRACEAARDALQGNSEWWKNCGGVKPRRELLDLAMGQGAILTGKPDGSEPIQLIFSIASWRAFDAEMLKVPRETTH